MEWAGARETVFFKVLEVLGDDGNVANMVSWLSEGWGADKDSRVFFFRVVSELVECA